MMQRKTHLETLVYDNYEIIAKYEAILNISDRPEERKRAQYMINEYAKKLSTNITNYVKLCSKLNLTISHSMVEIVETYCPGLLDQALNLATIEATDELQFPLYQRVKVLVLAANPSDTMRLRIDKEMREIDATLSHAEHQKRFEIIQHWAVRVADLQEYLLRHKPTIVHFSGHGSKLNGIILENDEGMSCPVSVSALTQLFSILNDNIK